MCCSGLSQEKALHKQPSKKINVMPSYPPNGQSEKPSRCRSDHDSLLQCHLARTFSVTLVSKNTPMGASVLGKRACPQLSPCVQREPSQAQGSGYSLGGCCGLLGTSSEAAAAFPRCLWQQVCHAPGWREEPREPLEAFTLTHRGCLIPALPRGIPP